MPAATSSAAPFAGDTLVPIGADHPGLAGHFPGHPIVPGVVLLDEALFAIGHARGSPIAPCRLATVKFLHPVVPPATLTVRHRKTAAGAIEFIVEWPRNGGPSIVASGRLDAAAELAP